MRSFSMCRKPKTKLNQLIKDSAIITQKIKEINRKYRKTYSILPVYTI